MSEKTSVFTDIVEGRLPAKIVHETKNVLAFHDINPSSPVHVLVIPKKCIPSLNDLSATHDALLVEMFEVVRVVVRETGIAETGYQVLIRTGRDGGQEIDHLHIHVNGGAPIDR